MEDLPEEDAFESEASSLANAEDRMILMHRDAHFAGNFDAMIEYYENEGKGVVQELDLERIRELADYETMTGKNLAVELLTGADAEKVGAARTAYKSLRELYSSKNEQTRGPRLIADLILSEDEVPEEEIATIAAEKGSIVPLLIGLLRSEDFYDSLFPGYGLAPTLAAQCLGKIGDKRALISLFEAIGEANFFSEDYLLDALENIGDPAKEFLLKIMQSEPINFDNERAAIALVRFKDDPDVARKCFQMLQKPVVWKDPALALHLVLACEGLKDSADQELFRALPKNPAFPKILEQDVKVVAKSFDHNK
jgi:hypothetical protein